MKERLIILTGFLFMLILISLGGCQAGAHQNVEIQENKPLHTLEVSAQSITVIEPKPVKLSLKESDSDWGGYEEGDTKLIDNIEMFLICTRTTPKKCFWVTGDKPPKFDSTKIFLKSSIYPEIVKDVKPYFPLETGHCLYGEKEDEEVYINSFRSPLKYNVRTPTMVDFYCSGSIISYSHSHSFNDKEISCHSSENDKRILKEKGSSYGLIVCSDDKEDSLFYNSDGGEYPFSGEQGGYLIYEMEN